MPDFRPIDENLRAAMRFFGEATGTGEIRVAEGAQMVYSGLDYGVFNIGFLDGIAATERTLASVLATCGRFYRERHSRWSFWLCESLLDNSVRRRSREIFADAGMRIISQAPGMTTPAFAAPVRSLAALEVRPVRDAATRAAFAELTTICFDIPPAVAQSVYAPEGAWRGAYQGFVGYAHGRPVAIAAIVRAAGVLGIYSLGTLPEFRRRGYGEAILRTAAAKMSENATAPEPLVLESTEAGYGLYRRLGFRDTTKFTVYLTK
ncbi:MAG TPA: GNAT family N-acetyltransferase [Bryobacteraceae bacterium]